MAATRPAPDILPLLREYAKLDRRRVDSGVTPEEYRQWMELQRRLGARLSSAGSERRRSERIETRMRVKFKTPTAFHEATLSNISRGGVFISTAFGPEIGTRLTLCLAIQSTGEELEIPCTVVSNNLGNDFSTASLGMGLRFEDLSAAQVLVINELHEQAAGRALLRLQRVRPDSEPDSGTEA